MEASEIIVLMLGGGLLASLIALYKAPSERAATEVTYLREIQKGLHEEIKRREHVEKELRAANAEKDLKIYKLSTEVSSLRTEVKELRSALEQAGIERRTGREIPE